MKRERAILSVILIVVNSVTSGFAQQTPAPSAKPTFTKQTLNLKGEEITIIRDNFGVPHIFATSESGAYFGGGYAVAQDRLYQLERFRRDARGMVAEIEGGLASLRDQQVRRQGYTEAELQAQFDAAPEEIKRPLRAYADGVNEYVREVTRENKLPAAFKQAGIDAPAEWKVTDSVAIVVMMAQRWGAYGGSESLKVRVLKWLKGKYGSEADKYFNDLYWIDDPTALTTTPDEKNSVSFHSPEKKQSRLTDPKRTSIAFQLETLSDQTLEQVDELADQRNVIEYNRAHNLPTTWGSFAWVISPQRSVSGNALLLGGPQMGFSTPAIAHEIHYSTNDLNVYGMSFAGIPGVLIGHNDHVAWTMTTGFTDMVDLFAEKIKPDNKYQYLYKGQYRDMEKRVEVVKIKGAEPIRAELYRTVHGPVLAWDEKAGIAYSRKVANAGNELNDLRAVFGFNRARNIKEFAKIAETIYSNLNYLAASVDGEIGYWHCGKLPQRAVGIDQRMPTPGTGEYEWVGVVPFSKMPQAINPKQGYLINWNNKPVKSWPNGDQAEWGPMGDSIARIEQLIKAQPRITFEQAREIAQDVFNYDRYAHHLKAHVLAALERSGAAARDPRIKQAVDYLQTWDNRNVDDSVPARIWRTTFVDLREAIFDEFLEINTIGLHLGAQAFDHIVQVDLLLRALEGRNAGVPLSLDYFNGKSPDEVIVASFIKSLDKLTEQRGPQMNLWGWKQRPIDLSPLPPLPFGLRSTYTLVVELSKPIFRTVTLLPPGQSEDPRSLNYADQREMAGFWTFKSTIYKKDLLEKALAAEQANKR
ncbi:MAG: penicillin acylase family protein [Blastocatellia bacterium]